MAATKLASELQRAIRHRQMSDKKFTRRTLAKEAGLDYGYVRSVVTGAIVTPPAKKLVLLGPPLGIPPERLLALTDQLGEAVTLRDPEPTDQSALIVALQAQTTALGKIAEAIQHRAESNAQLAAAVMRRLDSLEENRRADFDAFVEAIGERLLPLANAVRALSEGSGSGGGGAPPEIAGTRGP